MSPGDPAVNAFEKERIERTGARLDYARENSIIWFAQ